MHDKQRHQHSKYILYFIISVIGIALMLLQCVFGILKKRFRILKTYTNIGCLSPDLKIGALFNHDVPVRKKININDQVFAFIFKRTSITSGAPVVLCTTYHWNVTTWPRGKVALPNLMPVPLVLTKSLMFLFAWPNTVMQFPTMTSRSSLGDYVAPDQDLCSFSQSSGRSRDHHNSNSQAGGDDECILS
jgi:hypothetical protein